MGFLRASLGTDMRSIVWTPVCECRCARGRPTGIIAGRKHIGLATRISVCVGEVRRENAGISPLDRF